MLKIWMRPWPSGLTLATSGHGNLNYVTYPCFMFQYLLLCGNKFIAAASQFRITNDVRKFEIISGGFRTCFAVVM